MNASIGDFGLMAALIVSGVIVIAAIGAVRFGDAIYFRAARWGFGLLTIAFATASAALINALAKSDFSIAYVWEFTERALPVGYKLSAFWAGQQGSLLLWAMALAAMSLIFVVARRSDDTRQHALTIIPLALICGFFAAMILYAANPFAAMAQKAADGHGLNPMLQNIGMIAHPPALFLGYAGFTMPFVLMIGALLAGNVDNTWVTTARRWVLVSWVFLSIGIVLGAQWAYVELGWGGYWAWDPVENASLLPWLTGTALLHSIVVQQQRRMYKGWNLMLAGATFLLCMFGTYITRSGVIQSVHAFEKSLIGTFFLAFLIITTITTAGLIAARVSKLRGQTKLEGFVSKEGAVLIGNTMLVFMMLLTLLGTVFPLISGWIATQSITVQQGFYNKSVLPLAVLMLLMMGVAPLLGYGSAELKALARRLIIPIAISAIVMIAVTVLVGFSLWAAFCTLAISLTICGIIADYVKVVASRHRATSAGWLGCALGAIDANHRRYGGHLAHLGIAMIVAGVAGSSLYATKSDQQLRLGQSATVGSYTLNLDEIRTLKGENYEAAEAVLKVTDGRGTAFTIRPQTRQYQKAEQRSAEIAFRTGLREDLYVSLLGTDGDQVALQVIVNPLVIWLWIGGIALALGGIWSMLPQFMRSARPATDDVVEAELVTAS